MSVTSENHWSRQSFTPEEREIAATFLGDMVVQDPDSPIYGYYDPNSQARILVDAAIKSWEPPIPPETAERAGRLAVMVRQESVANTADTKSRSRR